MNGTTTGFTFVRQRVVAIEYPETAYALKWRDRLSLALVMWRLRGITPECHCLGGKWKIARGSKRTVGCRNNFFRTCCRYEYYIVLGRNAPIPGATSRLCRPNFSTLALNFYESSVRNLPHVALLTHIFCIRFWKICGFQVLGGCVFDIRFWKNCGFVVLGGCVFCATFEVITAVLFVWSQCSWLRRRVDWCACTRVS